MTRVVWFHCFSGIAGDMTLGALIDAGADLKEVQSLVNELPVDGWSLTAEATLRCGVAGTDLQVHVEGPQDGHLAHRHAGEILAMVEDSGFPERMERRVRATFETLAEVEGRLHGVPPAEVHFHEVGAIDSIIDVVGTCAALEVLDIDEVWSSAVALGGGTIDSAHGTLPIPAPATIGLLGGAPVYGTNETFELTTPTGAALLAAMATGWGPMPDMVVEATGYGAGDRDFDGRPNLLQAVIGTKADLVGPGVGAGQPLVQLEANVDDATGETLAHALARCLEVGARDAWVTPTVMKKGRPAHVISALCDPSQSAEVARVLTTETGSLGVRGHAVERWSVARSFETVDLDGHQVGVKVSTGRVKVEHDDAARVAAATGLPLREVVARAEAVWRDSQPE